MPRQVKFDRTQEDLGNILNMEHLNLTVPDQSIATWFYVTGLGLTRDPFVDFGSFNIWINAGEQQFHLPTGKPQVLRGEVHLVVPDLDQLEIRLSRIQSRLRETKYSFRRSDKHIVATCPWGNVIRISEENNQQRTGIKAIKFKAPAANLDGIARFYQQIFQCPVKQLKTSVEVTVGKSQRLIFAASKNVPEYDGHHIAIYCPDFSGPYNKIKAHKHISEESDQHQYRFVNIFDPSTGEVLFELEHEVRSLYHPMFNRNLVNRNPAQTFATYTPGRDHYYPAGT